MKTIPCLFATSLYALTFAACVLEPHDDTATGSETEAVTQAIAVPVGDPIGVSPFFSPISPPPVSVTAAVGDVLTLTATPPFTHCTAGIGIGSCNFTWYDPDRGIPRFGGVQIGSGQSLTVTESVAGTSRINLVYCVQTSSRFSRCVATGIFVTTH